jgi:transposase
MAQLQEGPGSRRPREGADYRVLLAEAFRPRPPASIAEAAQRIEQWTGLQRGPPQGRQFLKSLGMNPRKVGHLAAQAEVEAQEPFKTQALEPR